MIPRVTPNAMASEVSIFWKLGGPNLTISTACASGAHAIGQALMMLRGGRADVMLAGGAEAPILPLTFAGFDSLRVMSRRNAEPEKASRPFDRQRDGFVMGEGSGILVLETEEHAVRRGAQIYAELAGYGANGGGYHMVAPEPTGADALRAMQEALAEGELDSDSIGYINAHGTSTDLNDAVETKAIKNLLGQRARAVPISSTKSETGHLIGAAGGVEAAFTALALHTQVVPPTINYDDPDERCDLDYVPNTSREVRFTAALSNSFGFGNNNACLAFRKL
jgi:3-oxoacyl-(acyl-carrier-protein) synthase